MSPPTHVTRDLFAAAALSVALAGCATTPASGPDGTPRADGAWFIDPDAVAHIVRVVDEDTIVIGRGVRDGLVAPRADQVMTVSPRPAPTRERQTPAVSFGVRSAVVARVGEIGERETTLDLAQVAAPLAVGDYVSWVARVPSALRDDPVARCAYFDVGMRTLDGEQLVALHELVRGGPDAARAAVERMVAEIRARSELARSVHTTPADGGRFVGLDLSAAFARTTTEDMLAFLDFVASYPGKYLTWNWKLADIYGTWIINRAPPGESRHLAARLAPLERAADEAIAARDFTRAAASWRQILALAPGEKRAERRLGAIASLTRAEALLGDDPGDRAALWRRAEALGDLGLDADALAAWDTLIAAGHRTREAKKQRLWRLGALERWDEGLALAEALVAEQREEGVVKWLDYMRARTRLVTARGASDGDAQAEAHLELGRIRESERNWESAGADYRRALDAARAPELRERARTGQLRAARRQDLAKEEAEGLGKIGEHIVSAAASAAWAVTEEYAALGLDDEVARTLVEYADRAGEVHELDLQGALLERLAKVRPEEPGTWTRLGWHHVAAGRWDEAEAAFERAVKVKSLDLWARRSRAWLFATRGRYADAIAAATLSAKKDEDLAMVMTRSLVARGKRDEALELARAAAALAPKRFGTVVRAVERLRAASGKTDGAAALTRVRTLVELSLPELALAELASLERDPARRREAAWAIAQASSIVAPGGWALAAARVEGGSTPERARRLVELEAREAFAVGPTVARRRALAEALVARGALHEAMAVIGGGTTEVDHAERRVYPELQDVRARALRALEGERLVTLAAEATRRGDHTTAAATAARARVELAWAGVPSRALAVAVDEVRALDAAGRRDEAKALALAWLPKARADGNPFFAIDLEHLIARMDAASASVQIAELQDRHLATCLALEQEHCEAVVRWMRAEHARDRGRAADAVVELEAARRLWRGLYDADDGRKVALALAELRRQRGELADAIQLAESAYDSAVEAGDAPTERDALLELGTTALRVGDAPVARRWLTAAKVAGERGDDATTRGAASYWLGRLALDLEGDRQAARVELDRAAGIFAARDDRARRIAASTALARAWPERALAITEPLVGEARALDRKALLAEVLVERARALLVAGHAPEAATVADEARAIVATIDLPDVRARALHVAGDIARASGDPAATDHYLAAARAVAEALRRIEVGLPLGVETMRVIETAVAALYKDGRTQETAELIDAQRVARAGKLADLVRAKDDELPEELRELKRAQAEESAARARARDEEDKPAAEQDAARKQALAQVVARSQQEIELLMLRLQRDQRARAAAVSPVTLIQRRKDLPERVVVVQYLVASDALYAVVVRRADPEPKTLRVEVPRDRLVHTIARHRGLLAQDGRLAEATGRDLYDWLLGPLDGFVPEADRASTTVVVIAEGPLQYVPFAGLVASRRGEPTRYAIERWRLATALSNTIFRLFEPAPKRLARPSVLALLDPTSELEGARTELDGMPRVTTYRGPEATLAVFEREAARFPIVHVATHGGLSADPLRNGLRLADATLDIDRVGALTQLRHARLVVLSACQTGTEVADAVDAPDDEVISLARGFAIAGVPSIVASLWDVDDRATRLLMRAFYEVLGEGRGDTLDALRLAQRALLQDPTTADPRFWAAFNLLGDWR